MFNAAKINGGDGNRRAHDFYPTPKECVYSLLPELQIPRNACIWEPAAGTNAIVNALKEAGYYYVFGTDIQSGVDFLDTNIGADWIITNPPFTLAEQFIRHALELKVPFAFLLKIQYWNSAKRKKLFDEAPPQYIFPLTWRPDFTGQGNSLMDMMWCVWTPGKSAHTLYKPIYKRLTPTGEGYICDSATQ